MRTVVKIWESRLRAPAVELAILVKPGSYHPINPLVQNLSRHGRWTRGPRNGPSLLRRASDRDGVVSLLLDHGPQRLCARAIGSIIAEVEPKLGRLRDTAVLQRPPSLLVHRELLAEE